MEDPDDPPIPIRVGVRVFFVFTTENHEVGIVANIEGVLILTHVICSVVDTKRLVLVNRAMFLDNYLISLGYRVFLFVAIVF